MKRLPDSSGRHTDCPATAFFWGLVWSLWAPVLVPVLPAADLPPFERWSYWQRENDAGRTRAGDPSTNTPAFTLDHQGARDWSLSPNVDLAVVPGEIWEMTGRLGFEGEGSAGLGFVVVDPSGNVLDWMGGYRGVEGTAASREVRARYLVPEGVARLRPRLTGVGTGRTHFAAPRLVARGNPTAGLPSLPAVVRLENAVLAVALDPRSMTITVTDRRNGKAWCQRPSPVPLIPLELVQSAARTEAESEAGITPGPSAVIRCRDVLDDRMVTVTWQIDPREPEIAVAIESEGVLPVPLRFPAPFATAAGTWLILPMNEGIAFPVEDPETFRGELVTYGGHGICMAFWGVTDGPAAQMTLVETPDDAAVALEQGADKLHVARPVWHPQRGRFGYTRRLRYVFFDTGGHVAMCKRYRRHALEHGWLRTLVEKRREREAIDRLVGAVNVWYWGRDAIDLVSELQQAGIARILWSHQAPPEVLRELNARPGVLTSRYDIYQDAMNPDSFPRLRWVHPDWTSDAWPHDLTRLANGDWERGWEVETRDGGRIPCGVLCDRRALDRAIARIARDLESSPYRCRFIDTTTAAAWRECYATNHPMTRSESRACRTDLLGLVSARFGLVCGSETGHDAVVPVCDYFEGMLSLGPYRVPDAGRDMQRIWDQVPDAVARFQLGWRYRLPLWELVYHDCCVAQWYWGDYNNKLPALWDQRDRFNALYGTPPMFMFSREFWREHRDRFVRSYQATAPVARATAWHEMIDHRFLTPDRAVQQTRFANGATVTVNFSEKPFPMPDGTTIAPGAIGTAGIVP